MYFRNNILFLGALFFGTSLAMSAWAMNSNPGFDTADFDVYEYSADPESENTIVGKAKLVIDGNAGESILNLKISDFVLFPDTFCAKKLKEMEQDSLGTLKQIPMFALRKITEGITLVYTRPEPGKNDHHTFLLSLNGIGFATDYIAVKRRDDGSYFLMISVSHAKLPLATIAFSLVPKK